MKSIVSYLITFLAMIIELMLFLQTHNTRPYVACRVTGFHHETRTREVTRKDRHGRRYTDVETYRERVEEARHVLGAAFDTARWRGVNPGLERTRRTYVGRTAGLQASVSPSVGPGKPSIAFGLRPLLTGLVWRGFRCRRGFR